VVTTYAYDKATQRIANIQAALPPVPAGYVFNNFQFGYDPVGNVTSLTNAALPPATNSIGGPESKTYVYDDLYRLLSSAGTHTIASGATFKYTFSQSYDSIHNITHKTQSAMQNGAVNPQTTYDFAYTYPAPGSAHPHGPTAIGPFTITNDADGNQINTLGTGTSDQSEYLYDEENRLSCANKGPQAPSPSCNAQGNTQFIYDHDSERKVKDKSTPTIYPNQHYTDFGGGSGNQFKHIFIGSERILTKKARIAPDRQHWYYHTDHLHSTGMVTNEQSAMVDAIHYFPFGEVWLEEVPASLPMDYFFTAKELDQETGFYDFGARYLDPRFSKWMTADPALGSYLPGIGKSSASLPSLGGAFRPTNLALYGYGHHNPATLWDPNGRETAPNWNTFGYSPKRFEGDPIGQKLQDMTTKAAKEFDAQGMRGFTAGQRGAIAKHSWLQSVFRGYNIDKMVRIEVAKDPELSSRLSGVINNGVDFKDSKTGMRYDMTTEDEFINKKMDKYGRENLKLLDTGRDPNLPPKKDGNDKGPPDDDKINYVQCASLTVCYDDKTGTAWIWENGEVVPFPSPSPGSVPRVQRMFRFQLPESQFPGGRILVPRFIIP
jgi:RHS repeat-associated protein